MKPEHSTGIVYLIAFIPLLLVGWSNISKPTEDKRFVMVLCGGACIALILARAIFQTLS